METFLNFLWKSWFLSLQSRESSPFWLEIRGVHSNLSPVGCLKDAVLVQIWCQSKTSWAGLCCLWRWRLPARWQNRNAGGSEVQSKPLFPPFSLFCFVSLIQDSFCQLLLPTLPLADGVPPFLSSAWPVTSLSDLQLHRSYYEFQKHRKTFNQTQLQLIVWRKDFLKNGLHRAGQVDKRQIWPDRTFLWGMWIFTQLPLESSLWSKLRRKNQL